MTISINKFKAIVISIIGYGIWIILYQYIKQSMEIPNYIITVLSWIGILIIIYYFRVWYKIKHKLLTLYNIFLMFFITFNFGQCLLWAFGIHTDKEIGSNLLYGVVNCDNKNIAIAQLIFIICFIMINCGAILINNKTTQTNEIDTDCKNKNKALFYTSLIISFISIPITLYIVSKNYITASMYGYKSLYYGDHVNNYNTWMEIAMSLFLPCLIGLLIGSNYKKSVRFIVYVLFGIYAFISLMCGDRGEWIMKLIILFWADNEFYKKKKLKKMICLLIVAYIGLYIMNAIVSLRNVGISLDKIILALTSAETNPIVSLLTEFGNSMGINVIVANNNVIFPYGNTYIMSIITMLSTSVAEIFNIGYMQLHTWFSSEYLGISYGADFTIIGEAILNFGIYLAPFMMIFVGMIVSKVCFMGYNKNEPFLICLSLNAVALIFKWARTTTWIVLNGISYSVIIMSIVYTMVLLGIRYKQKNNKECG